MDKTNNPGQYRHKISFIQKSTAKDNYGEQLDTWTVVKTTWAYKEPILGNEYFASLTSDTKVEVKFGCRYMPGITNDMRIQHGTQIYEILSAINVKELNKDLLVYARLVR